MTVTVRPVTPSDREEWAVAYRGYRDFYQVDHDQTAIDTVWSWLHDESHEVRGLVAELDGKVVGLAHYRSFARPLAGATGIFLDDLFTTPEARGHGAATALMDRLGEIARDEGAVVVRWLTAEDNETARRLYDQRARATKFITYDMPPAA